MSRAAAASQAHGLRLHRRLPARPRRPARRPPRDHALGLSGAARPPATPRSRRPRADLPARRPDLDLGRRHGRNGPRARARGGGSRPRRGARRSPVTSCSSCAAPATSRSSARRSPRSSPTASRCARSSASCSRTSPATTRSRRWPRARNMSPRHFARAFRAETGVTPGPLRRARAPGGRPPAPRGQRRADRRRSRRPAASAPPRRCAAPSCARSASAPAEYRRRFQLTRELRSRRRMSKPRPDHGATTCITKQGDTT